MAEALFKQSLQRAGLHPNEWQVLSAGLRAAPDQPASLEAILVMNEMGIDLSRHRSRLLDSSLVVQANLILCMEMGHKQVLEAGYPDHANKIHLLSEMAGAEYDIADPFGESASDYQRTAQMIKDYIGKGWKKIMEMAVSR